MLTHVVCVFSYKLMININGAKKPKQRPYIMNIPATDGSPPVKNQYPPNDHYGVYNWPCPATGY